MRRFTFQPTGECRSSEAVRPNKKATSRLSKTRPVDHLQGTIGNQVLQRLLDSQSIQARLEIGRPGDRYERQADRVADAVMRMPGAGIKHTQALSRPDQTQLPGEGKNEPVRRQEEEREEKNAPVMAKPVPHKAHSLPPRFGSRLRSAQGEGRPLAPQARGLLEPRFGVDFDKVRIHTGAQADRLNRSINAQAFTHGRDIYFRQGRFDSYSASGKRLLAHELTHVVQQGGVGRTRQQAAFPGSAMLTGGAVSGLQRKPDKKVKKDKIKEYVKILRTTKAIEGKSDSKSKALKVVEQGFKGTKSFWLPDAQVYLLVEELLRGKVSDDDRAGIIEVLERMGNSQLGRLFGKIPLATLVKAFPGKKAARLEDFFTRRYEGGLKAVQAGTIKPKGDWIPPGMPLSVIAVARKLLKWLKTNKKTAPNFFKSAWSSSKLLLLGEMHFDDVQREFAADMLKASGGKDTGLALEIPISQQGEIDYYIKHGTLPKGAKAWWKSDARYKKLIEAAKAKNVQVIAMDTSASTDRDKHMATEVEKLAKTKTKILVYVGAMHIKEASSGALGGRLASKFGGKSHSMDMFHPGKSDHVYWMIKAAFPTEKSMGFDIDASPLAGHPDPDFLKHTFGTNLDGYIYFAKASAYK